MRNKNALIIIAFIAGSLSGCSSSDTRYGVSEFDEIPDMLDYHNVPGVSIAIIKDYEVEQLLTYGVKNQDTLAPVTPDTLFQAASISKAVTAVAAMTMWQNGMIDGDEDINKELVSWSVDENEYTVEEKVNLRRLLSHTAGTTVHGFSGYSQNEVIPSIQEILNGQSPANSPAIVVDNTPGSLFSYSGGGYTIVQQALIDVTQQSFEDLMYDTVLQPLAMTSSSFNQGLQEDDIARISAGHDSGGQNVPGDFNRYPEMAAAGLWTTAHDLAKLLIELQLSMLNQSNNLLAGEVVEQMLTPVGDPVFNTTDLFYGLGFMVKKRGDEDYFGHGGVNTGFISQMAASKDSGDGYVVMTNGDNGQLVIEEIESLIENMQSRESY